MKTQVSPSNKTNEWPLQTSTIRRWMIDLRLARHGSLECTARFVKLIARTDKTIQHEDRKLQAPETISIRCPVELLEIVEGGGTTTPRIAEAIGKAYGMTRDQMQEIACRPLGTSINNKLLQREPTNKNKRTKRTRGNEAEDAQRAREMRAQGMKYDDIKRELKRGSAFVSEAIYGAREATKT